jgi:hypothetical protein
LEIPTCRGVVVTEVVVVEAGLGLKALAGEAVVVGGRAGEGVGLAERAELGVPHHLAGRVGHLLRRAEVVGVHEPQFGRGTGVGDERQRQAGEVDVLAGGGAGGVALGDQTTVAVVVVVGGGAAGLLHDALAQRVVLVGGDRDGAGVDGGEAVRVVVGQGRAAAVVGDRVAGGVVAEAAGRRAVVDR